MPRPPRSLGTAHPGSANFLRYKTAETALAPSDRCNPAARRPHPFATRAMADVVSRRSALFQFQSSLGFQTITLTGVGFQPLHGL
jgi:hypothetical protein